MLELLFVYGFDWGIAGSAWGTAVAQLGMGAAFVVAVFRRLAPGEAAVRLALARRVLSLGKWIFIRTTALMSSFVLAGAVRADSNASGFWNAGSGGSVNLSANAIITSPLTRITANGGDENASLDSDRGGGPDGEAGADEKAPQSGSVSVCLSWRGGVTQPAARNTRAPAIARRPRARLFLSLMAPPSPPAPDQAARRGGRRSRPARSRPA